jgi:magnesium transporter
MLLRGAGRLLGVPPRRARLVERRGTQAGVPPGTLREQPGAQPAVIEAFRYSAEGFEERASVSADEAAALVGAPGVTWINVDGHRDAAAIRRLGEAFGLHPLVQEDLTSTHQRPKLEPYGERQLFVVVKMANPGSGPAEDAYAGGQCDHDIEQVAFVLGPDYLLSFQEDAVGDVFDPVRDRIRAEAGRLRSFGPDYLLYALLDVIVDHYFITLERIGDATERMEVEVFENPTPKLLGTVQALRREVVVLRRVIWPLREVLAALLRDESPLISDRTRLYLRDVYDHQIQAVDTVETIRDVLDGLVDHYLSAVSYRTNEVMRVLTVVGTIFLPLTLITSCYGMNFDHMPELHTRYGYFVVVGVMVAVTVGILGYFRRRRWI